MCLRNVDKHRSLQKRIICLHLSISGFATVYVHCTHYMVYGHTLHWILWLPQVSICLNSVGYKAKRVKKWHVENVTDNFFLLLLFFGEFLNNMNEVKVLLTYCMPCEDGLNKVQGY